ncbi:MAG: trypsin-like peptidase domain-containing protein [Oscillospiraceae bacterium]|jgi:hypothetical protein|nr:trypsin-like peptidase domain-containing protein [Oscillospiraceae bacterium]
MKKRVLLLVVCLALITQCVLAASLSNFAPSREYRSAFSDVAASAWYYDSVKESYELGLMDGRGGGKFEPSGYLTLGESVKLAVTLHSVYETGKAYGASGSPWYAPFVDYAVEKGIIAQNDFPNYNARATRSDFAKILARALPDEALTPVNAVPDGAVPDVEERYSYGGDVYMLYRAGVLTGSGSEGEFYPGMPVTRAEAATVLLRMARPEYRAMLQKAGALSAEDIYKKCSPAVFFIEVLNEKGEVMKLGSGFFISSSGLAVTNSHMIADALRARATLPSGEKREITGIYGYDMKTDCALIQVAGSGYPTLEIGDYAPKTGAEIYTIGNPIGLINSYSRGIVSSAERELDGMRYIQIDAAISPGSSGGALLDAAGRVIGITSAAVNGGQSLNLAMPIGVINALQRSKLYALGQVPVADKLYENAFPAPDFGAYAGIKPSYTSETRFSQKYTYDITGLGDAKKLADGYAKLLEKYSFTSYNSQDGEETYYNSLFSVAVAFRWEVQGEYTLFFVEIM